MTGNSAQSRWFSLHDEQDYSRYLSVQTYKDNAVNPCQESTYRFIQHLYSKVKELHEPIQPLQVFHFGGDEVARGAWQNSTACAPFLKDGINLKREFTRRVSEITREVTLGAWEDGLMDHDSVPWNRSLLANRDVITQAWQNVWEWGAASRAYNLANAGYKDGAIDAPFTPRLLLKVWWTCVTLLTHLAPNRVVFSPVTSTYLDHPQEPSPEERGFYWGTRYTDAFKAFHFMPDHYYKNIDIKRSGEAITVKGVCNEDNSGCPPLKSPENIIGLQGQLWSETVREPEQLEYMIFPRILALAERGWHKASWEGKDNIAQDKEMKSDWSRFARSLGFADLLLLDKLNISYRVPPPGARISNDKILSKVEFPGLKVQYRMDSESSWSELDSSKSFKNVDQVSLRTLSADGKRFSSEVKVKIVKPAPTSNKNTAPVYGCLVWLTLLCLFAHLL
ncbi:hypothetical protein Btru_038144 [Bulinus truncatus]|nr:hypothetical protein Btru_038144 [Bulinus truncatus]